MATSKRKTPQADPTGSFTALHRSETLDDKCARLAKSGKKLVWPEIPRPLYGGQKTMPRKDSIPNVEAFLEWAEIRVWRDSFADVTRVEGIPDIHEWNDTAAQVVWAAANRYGLRPSELFVYKAVSNLAGSHRVHPVRDYLARVQSTWDGKPRVDTWLTRYCGVRDSQYVRAAGAVFMVGGVRRIRQPGCKFETMLVLEGRQGVGKSSVAKTLAVEDDWFSENLEIGSDPKVVIEQTRGKWIVEMPELTGLSRREVEAVKHFVSRHVDEARGAYKRDTSKYPRAFVLVGTTNATQYLLDDTGNRRFMPVRCEGGAGSIDIEGLTRDRDQLWGEAAAREAAGEPIWIPKELWPVAARVVEERRVPNDLEAELQDAGLGEIDVGYILKSDIKQALKLDRAAGKNLGGRNWKGIADCLARFGFRPLKPGELKVGEHDASGYVKMGEGWCEARWKFDEEKERFVRAGGNADVAIDDDADY